MTTKLCDAIKFFRANGNAPRYAKALAEAEAFAREIELTVIWEQDIDPDVSWFDKQDAIDYEAGRFEMLCARIEADGSSLAVLGGIAIRPGDRDYRRVIEAELFCEAIAELKKGTV